MLRRLAPHRPPPQDDHHTSEEKAHHGPGLARVFAAIALPIFIAAIDTTAVSLAQPAIAADLGGEFVSWILVAYLFAATISVPIIGSIGDAVGRQRLLFICLLIAASGALLSAMAPSMVFLVAARMVHGVGGGGSITLALALVGELVPARKRGSFHGVLASIFVMSSAAGPLAGGILTQTFGWRAVFLAMVPLCLLGMLLLRSVKGRRGDGRAGRFDLVGVLLLSFGVSICFAVLRYVQSASVDWRIVLGGTLVAAGLVYLFVRRERNTEAPLVPVRLLARPILWRINLIAALHGSMLTMLFTIVPIYLIAAKGVGPATVGPMLLPMTLGVGIGSMVTGWLIGRFGQPTLFPFVGLAATAALLALAAFLEPQLAAMPLAWFLGGAALFMGTVMVSVQITAQAEVNVTSLGMASAAIQFSRSMGAAFGAAVAAILVGLAIARGDSDLYDPVRFGETFRIALALGAATAIVGALTAGSASGPRRRDGAV